MSAENSFEEHKDKVLSQDAVMCSSCNTIIKNEDKKHCFWDEDVEQGVPLMCFDCYVENESIIRDFGF